MAKWKWAHGMQGKKMLYNYRGYGGQADFVTYDLRGCVGVNYYHRNADNEMDKRLAWRKIREIFKPYGKNLITIDQYRNNYSVQAYFLYDKLPSADLVGTWMGAIKSAMNEC